MISCNETVELLKISNGAMRIADWIIQVFLAKS